MGYEIVPRNRLNVFISSAQREEDGLQWEELRERIASSLRECPFLNPFIIEENASELSSTQHFLFHVKRADVLVLLVKGEVRPGTSIEVAAAIKENKPILLYFHKEGVLTEEAERVKREVQRRDYCSYVRVDSFEGIEDRIRQDIVENVIEYYQFKHYENNNTEDVQETSVSFSEEIKTAIYYAPTKAALSLFESAYEHIFDLLNMPILKTEKEVEPSALHALGISALNWLLLGNQISHEDGIPLLLESAQSIYGRTDWLALRWNAILHANNGEFEKALSEEQMALTMARTAGVPNWIESDILIDCRNLRIEIDNMSRQMTFTSPEQQELDKTETIIYLPIADRYIENALEKTLKQEIDLKISPPSTTHLGSNLSYTIRDVVSYFFSALIYGSYTHMFVVRERLADVLFKYSEMLDWPELLFPALKMLILSGNSKKFKQTVETYWDNSYSEIVTNADEYWEFAKRADLPKRDGILLSVISILGLYFSDEAFAEASNYIAGFLPLVYWGNSEDYLKAILDNLRRFSQENVIDIIADIIKEKKYHLGRTLSSILMQVKLDGVSYVKQASLCNVLKENLPQIVERNGNPQLIAALQNSNPDVFAELASIPDNGLKGIEKLYYDLNVGSGDIRQILTEMIAAAKSQFETNKNEGCFTSFAFNPYHTISSIVKDYFSVDIVRDLNESFIPLCKEVFESNAPIPIKGDCCASLCDVLSRFKEESIAIPEIIIPVISELGTDGEEVFLIQHNTTRTFSCRVLLLKIIAGLAKKEDLIGWSMLYSKMTPPERVVLVESIEKYLRYEKTLQDSIDGVILAIVLQCLEDNYYVVRIKACDCLVYFVNSGYHDIAKQKLIEVTLDSSHYVRNRLIRLCRREIIPEEALRNQIIAILQRDANYALRMYANIL